MKSRIILNNERSILVDDPKRYLLDQILKMKNEIGTWPTFKQMLADPNNPSQYSYAYNFKTYEKAIEEAKLYERRKSGMKPTASIRAKYKDYFAQKNK